MRISEIESNLELLKNDALEITSETYNRRLKEIEEGFTTHFDKLEKQLKNFSKSAPLSYQAPLPAALPTTASTNSQISSSSSLHPPGGQPTNALTQPKVDSGHKHHSQNLELLICFDSNWQYVNRRKLWKENGSELKQCGTLFDVSQVISNCHVKELKHFLLHVGTNDLDTKHYLQVFDELKQLLDDVRSRFPGVKLIVSELLPRNDEND